MSRPLSFSGRLRSFRCAGRGIGIMLASQHNAWLHAAATVVVVGAGLLWRITAAEWCAIVLAIVAVWMAEGLNTALEFLADATSPVFHPLIGKAKDVAAGAVLLAAVGAVVVGLLIFGPHVRQAICEVAATGSLQPKSSPFQAQLAAATSVKVM